MVGPSLSTRICGFGLTVPSWNERDVAIDLEGAVADDAAQVAFDQFTGDELSVIFRYWHCLENLDD